VASAGVVVGGAAGVGVAVAPVAVVGVGGSLGVGPLPGGRLAASFSRHVASSLKYEGLCGEWLLSPYKVALLQSSEPDSMRAPMTRMRPNRLKPSVCVHQSECHSKPIECVRP
jgi:hypothetical protein